MEIERIIPGEKLTYNLNFTDALDTGVTISSATVTAVRYHDGTSPTSSVLTSGTGTVTGSNKIVQFTIYQTSDGVDYLVTVTCTLSNGNFLKGEVLFKSFAS